MERSSWFRFRSPWEASVFALLGLTEDADEHIELPGGVIPSTTMSEAYVSELRTGRRGRYTGTVISRRVVDASPLIFLTKVGLLEVLREPGVPALVPDVVLGEIGGG